MMAPTEILANQHYETIKELLFGMDIRVELLTGSIKGKKREAILTGLLTGDVKILIGTHNAVAKKEDRERNAIYLEHGKPMLFGPNKEFGLMQEGRI